MERMHRRRQLPDEPLGTAAILACAPEDVEQLGSRGLVAIGEVR